MKITTKPLASKGEQQLDWLYRGLLISAICFSVVACHKTSKPEIKPQAAATTTPHGWSWKQTQSNHEFICPTDRVMMGRLREGKDENGKVSYRCATVDQFGPLKTNSPEWTGNHDENNHWASCPMDKVITGMSHVGDENAPTRYHCSFLIDAWGNPLQPIDGDWQDKDDESNHTFECAANQVLNGRGHHGDEHESTDYRCATLW